MTAVVEEETAVVVKAKAAVVLPAGTLTVEGVMTAVELLLNVTEAPPLGAGPVSVMVP
jgi:hypothetical protein